MMSGSSRRVTGRHLCHVQERGRQPACELLPPFLSAKANGGQSHAIAIALSGVRGPGTRRLLANGALYTNGSLNGNYRNLQ